MMSLKTVDGVGTLEGASVALGCEELYVPVCYPHFYEKTQGEEEVGGVKNALKMSDAILEATAPCKARKVDDVDDVGDAVPRRSTGEPDQELTPEKATSLQH